MLDEVAGMFDADAREALFMRMQEIVAEDPPFVNVFWRLNGVVAAKGLGGVHLSSDNMQHDMREIYLIVG
jgi:ABC-type transport system substrate-binding protein